MKQMSSRRFGYFILPQLSSDPNMLGEPTFAPLRSRIVDDYKLVEANRRIAFPSESVLYSEKPTARGLLVEERSSLELRQCDGESCLD